MSEQSFNKELRTLVTKEMREAVILEDNKRMSSVLVDLIWNLARASYAAVGCDEKKVENLVKKLIHPALDDALEECAKRAAPIHEMVNAMPTEEVQAKIDELKAKHLPQ